MCIIVYKPQEIKLFEETLSTCFENNADGAGFAYVEDEKLHIEKGFYTFSSFMEAYIPHQTKQALLHFRIRTHGSYEETNCHPFEVTPNLVFAHNGMIHKMPVDKNKSDTALFNELILQNLVRVYGKRILFDSSFVPLLEGYSFSKFVFMDNKGNVSIINEKDGEWNSKCWFSNKTYAFKYKTYEPEPKQKGKRRRHIHAPPLDYTPTYQQDSLPPLPPPNPPALPYTSEGPLQQGEFVRLTMDMGMCQKDWLGRVMAFYGDGQIEVYFPLRKVAKKVPLVYLERVVPTVIHSEE